jgi:hypothetical protein
VVLQQKDAPGTGWIVAPIALGTIGLFAIFDHADPLTLRALHRHNRHHRSPSIRETFVPVRLSRYQLNENTTQEGIICPAAHDIGHYMARMVIKRVPQPPYRLFVANKTLHLVKFYLEPWALIARLPRRRRC